MSGLVVFRISSLLLLFLPLNVLGQRGGPPRRIANPETIHLESGARVEFHSFESEALGGAMSYSVFLPSSYDDGNKTYPVIYFLHGLNNDHTSWCADRYGNLPQLLDRTIVDDGLPEFVMVHPEGGRGYYTDSADGRALAETALQVDLIGEIESRFRVRRDREGRAIAGTSMGGYGALKLAFKHPDFYGSVVASSPIVLTGEDPEDSLNGSASPRGGDFVRRLIHQIYGDPVDLEHWRHNSLEFLAQHDLKGLHVLMLYGTADRYNQLFPMEEGIRSLDRILSKRGVADRLEIFPGEPHGWELVRNHFPAILKFLAQTF